MTSIGAAPERAFGRSAYAIADHLASSIGPRPAASHGEQQALAYAEELLDLADAQSTRFTVDNIPGPVSRRSCFLPPYRFLRCDDKAKGVCLSVSYLLLTLIHQSISRMPQRSRWGIVTRTPSFSVR